VLRFERDELASSKVKLSVSSFFRRANGRTGIQYNSNHVLLLNGNMLALLQCGQRCGGVEESPSCFAATGGGKGQSKDGEMEI
jgi:hypothetical protein